MKYINICYVIILVSSVSALIYGISAKSRMKKSLYYSMGILAIACQMTGQLAYCITSFTGHTQQYGFHVGMLGAVGCCLFFMTANMGPVDLIADDKSREMRKYRLLASTAPMAVMNLYLLCVFIMSHHDCYDGFIINFILAFATTGPMYFSFKMAIIPDEEGGFIYCMRRYNLTITILGLLNTLERGLRNFWSDSSVVGTVIMFAIYICIAVCTVSVVVFLVKGEEQWKNT